MLDPNNVLSVMHSNFTKRRSLTQGASIILPKLDQTGRQPPSTATHPRATAPATGHPSPLLMGRNALYRAICFYKKCTVNKETYHPKHFVISYNQSVFPPNYFAE